MVFRPTLCTFKLYSQHQSAATHLIGTKEELRLFFALAVLKIHRLD
jgi:hypothetical protein